MPEILNNNLKSPLEVKIEWARSTQEPPLTLSISAIMLNKKDIIDKLEDFVFYGSDSNGNDIISHDKSVTCDMIDFNHGFGAEHTYKMRIELAKIRKDIDKVHIVVSINTKGESSKDGASFDSLTKAKFTIKDCNGLTYTTDLCKNSDSRCQCVDVGLVRRYDNSWRFEDELNLYLGGLDMAYEDYADSKIFRSNPFSTIGNLTIVEEKYKQTHKETTVAKDGSKSIIETATELITTVIGQIAGSSKEDPKPWKRHVRRHAQIPINQIEETDVALKKKDSKSKPWKGKTRAKSLSSQILEGNMCEHKDTEDIKMASSPEQEHKDIDPVDKTSTLSRKKFPKVKHHDVEPSSGKDLIHPFSENVDEDQTATKRRKFPKVRNRKQ